MKIELENMLDDCAAELEDIEQRIENMDTLDKGRRYLTNYGLIRACGTVEFVYRSIIVDYFEQQLSNNRINTYLDSTIRQGSNSAKYENMKKLLKNFDDQWSLNFSNMLKERDDGQRLISAANSLVNNRHNFAHGKSTTATFLDIKNYYNDIVQLLRIFDSVVC